uniref:DUF7713 domain-containing protein n=1 Tax=Paraburkholderia franconis TaxID=2654983 RepID=UPI001D129A19|nr:hypothetical protein [Paraburkholderia franconis]
MRLADADGVVHQLQFRSLLFGDQLSLETLELASREEDCVGFRFQLLGDPKPDPFELLENLVRKVKRALTVRHLVEHAGNLEVAGTTVCGRIEWDSGQDSGESGRLPCVLIDGRRVDWTEFGAMLMAFEGWQFRIELVDPRHGAYMPLNDIIAPEPTVCDSVTKKPRRSPRPTVRSDDLLRAQ